MKHYDIEWCNDHFVVTFHDTADVCDVLRANDAWIADPRFDAIDFVITDLSAITRTDFADQDLHKVASCVAVGEQWRRGKPLRVALVVPNGEVEQMVRRYIAVTVDGWERRVFRSHDEAMRWACGQTPVAEARHD